MRRRLNRRTVAVVLVALAGLALAALAVGVLAGGGSGSPTRTTALPQHPVASRFEPNDLTIEECADEDQACLEQAYGNLAFESGPSRALAAVEADDVSATNACHRIVHIIGAASLARYEGNVGRTFAEGSSTCASGYYHGVLERSLVNVRSRAASVLGGIVRGLCSDPEVRANAELEYQCLHGLGHGLMITTGYDLPVSLRVCDHLRTDDEATSCNGGVFMENISTSYGVQSRWVREDDPVYPCNWVAEEDKLTCYQLVTSRIIRVNGVDWEETAETCAGVEKAFVGRCFESYGRDVAGQTKRDPEEIEELCAVARPYGGEDECITFAAYDLVQNDTTGQAAAMFCDRTDGELRATCYHAVGSIMARSRSTAAETKSACRSLTSVKADVRACMRGATTRLLAPLSR
jgi:copper chaperone CopZ